MLVRRGNDGAPFPTRFVGAPANAIGPVANLHGLLVVMPGANLPNRRAVCQLLPDVEFDILESRGIKQEDVQPSVGAGAFQAEFRAGAEDFVAGGRGRISIVSLNPGLQFGFITAPGRNVVIPAGDEVRKPSAKNVRDPVIKGGRVTVIVQIAGVDH